MSEEKAKRTLGILVPILIAVLSIFVLSSKIPQTKYFENTVACLEENNDTVMKFAGVTLGASVAITMLPDDLATPVGEQFAGMTKYFVVILIAIYLEKLLTIEGVKFALVALIPAGCGFYLIGNVIRRESFKIFARKLFVLGTALVLAIPTSTHLSDALCEDYMAYVEETISETADGSDKINDVMASSDENENVFDKLSKALKTAVQSVSDMLSYFNNMVRKCMNSIAILVVKSCVIPLVVMVFLLWLVKELFGLSVPVSKVVDPKKYIKTYANLDDNCVEERI